MFNLKIIKIINSLSYLFIVYTFILYYNEQARTFVRKY